VPAASRGRGDREREREGGEERRAVGTGGEREREGKAFGLSARPVRVGLGLLGRRVRDGNGSPIPDPRWGFHPLGD